MRKDIKEYCTTCPVCIANTRCPFRTLLQPHELATAPFLVLGMDFLGPITPVSPYGNSYIMVITDYFSKWVEVATLPDYSAQTTCDAFYRLIIQRHGPPNAVVLDRDSNFTIETSELLSRFRKSIATQTPTDLPTTIFDSIPASSDVMQIPQNVSLPEINPDSVQDLDRHTQCDFDVFPMPTPDDNSLIAKNQAIPCRLTPSPFPSPPIPTTATSITRQRHLRHRSLLRRPARLDNNYAYD